MISNSTVLNTNTDVVSVPSGKNYAVTGIMLCNVGGSDEQLTAYAVPNGGSAGDSTKIMSNFLLPSGNTYFFDFKLLLGSLDKIVFVGATGSLVTATPTWLEI